MHRNSSVGEGGNAGGKNVGLPHPLCMCTHTKHTHTTPHTTHTTERERQSNRLWRFVGVVGYRGLHIVYSQLTDGSEVNQLAILPVRII
jgi:hypothetical protein